MKPFTDEELKSIAERSQFFWELQSQTGIDYWKSAYWKLFAGARDILWGRENLTGNFQEKGKGD